MKKELKILLDTNIILQRPQLLAKKKEGVVLAVPFPVRLELAVSSLTRSGATKISKLVDDAVDAGNVQIEKLTRVPSLERTGRLSGTDVELITLAQELGDRGEKVAIASQDRELTATARSLGIQSLSLSDVEGLLSLTTVNAIINLQAKSVLSSQKRVLIVAILSGALFGGIVLAVWAYFPILVSALPVWGTLLCVILIGILAYALRGRYRLHYGIFEFFFGAIIAIRVFWPEFNYGRMQASDFLQVLAGIYVMVRGLDNIGKALQSSRFGPLWKKLSGE